MRHVNFTATPAANLDTYRSDPPLWAEIQEALSAIERDEPAARETPLRVHGGTAWAIRIRVHGRDNDYQVIWAATEGGATVVHLGPALS
jgi:hypothetical protein